jgi:hypothetical protein
MALFLGGGEVSQPYHSQAGDSRYRANHQSSEHYKNHNKQHNEKQYAYPKFRHCSHFAVLFHVAGLQIDTV